MSNTGKLTIGRLAKSAGVGVETIRFYERKGILQRPRAQSGYREYQPEDAQRIRFTKRAQDLGFTLKEIRHLLDFYVSKKAGCGEIKDVALAKVAEIEGKINDLKNMKRSLERISTACGKGRGALSKCRLLDCFGGGCECCSGECEC